MKISSIYRSKYLRADDSGDEPVTYLVSKFSQELLGEAEGEKVLKGVLHFRGVDRPLVLNVTNARAIARVYGDDTDTWTGRPVTLFVADVQFKADIVRAIRISVPKPKPAAPARSAKPQPTPPPADPAGYVDPDDADDPTDFAADGRE